MYPELTGAPAGADLAAQLLRILVPTILFLSLAGAISGVLYSFERFTMPAVVSIVWNLTIIAAIALFHDTIGVDAIAWGMLVGTAARGRHAGRRRQIPRPLAVAALRARRPAAAPRPAAHGADHDHARGS